MKEEIQNDAMRHEIVNLLDDLMAAHPDWRIGQLVANVAFLALHTKSAVWDVKNEGFLRIGRQHLLQLSQRRQAADVKELVAQQIKPAA